MLGIDATKLGGKRVAPAEPPIIWPDMADSFALFVASQTQWRFAAIGMAGTIKTGLDYAALEPVARFTNIAITPEVFADVRTLEAEALRVWSKRRSV